MAQRLILPNHILLSEVEKLLGEGQTVMLRVKGNSMLPFIRGDRDSVILQSALQYRVGDIVLARLNEEHRVLHRIVSLNKETALLMGDGNLQGIEWCSLESISGKVMKIIRNERAIDCMTSYEICKVKIWRMLLPIRRYLLAIYREFKFLSF